jgi:hypothetical protein
MYFRNNTNKQVQHHGQLVFTLTEKLKTVCLIKTSKGLQKFFAQKRKNGVCLG